MPYVTDMAHDRREPEVEFALIEREMLGDLWVSSHLWNTLAYLCDVLSRDGSRARPMNDARAIFSWRDLRSMGLTRWAPSHLKCAAGIEGPARLALLDGDEPLELPVMALPGTPGCDLEAEIIDVGQGAAKDFERLGTAVAGKIAFNTADGTSRTEMYRGAAEAGAAAFIFSGGQPGMLVPTGSINGDMPAIGLAYEGKDAAQAPAGRRPARARLVMACRVHPVTAYNIVAEIPGTDPSQGWILAGGHYDGHDIGQAAQDNGAGAAVLVEAARLLAAQRQHLKAGIRFVLFSGEELGLYGSYAYAKAHAGQFDETRLIFNADVVAMAMPLVLQNASQPGAGGIFPQPAAGGAGCHGQRRPQQLHHELRSLPVFGGRPGRRMGGDLGGAGLARAGCTSRRIRWTKVEPRLLRQTAGDRGAAAAANGGGARSAAARPPAGRGSSEGYRRGRL
jgi:hypothetical protein